jgi:hypothetical protein
MSTCAAAANNQSLIGELHSRPFSGLYAGLLGLMGLTGLVLNSVVLVGVVGNARLGTTVNKLLVWICGVAIMEASAGIIIKALILSKFIRIRSSQLSFDVISYYIQSKKSYCTILYVFDLYVCVWWWGGGWGGLQPQGPFSMVRK